MVTRKEVFVTMYGSEHDTVEKANAAELEEEVENLLEECVITNEFYASRAVKMLFRNFDVRRKPSVSG